MSNEEMDFVALMHKSAKPTRQCAEAAKKSQLNLRNDQDDNTQQEQKHITEVVQITHLATVRMSHSGMVWKSAD